jgi:hypothetical protein
MVVLKLLLIKLEKPASNFRRIDESGNDE